MDKQIDLDGLSNDQLIDLRNNTEKDKWKYYREFEKLGKHVQYLESIIFKKCVHVWEYDYTASGPYDGPDKICKKCKLYNNKYMYQVR
jgi:hypothetical protein